MLGVRHLSPNGAFNVVKKLDEQQPKIVLIEGPSDFNSLIPQIVQKEVKLPIAILAYTLKKPIETILYPLAEYSPEYQAILWCYKNNVECKFIDLPSTILLHKEEEFEENENISIIKEETPISIYEKLDETIGHEAFWEGMIEHNKDDYFRATEQYGKELRKNKRSDAEKNFMRESYMRIEIEKAYKKFGVKKVAVIAGAYHLEGLQGSVPVMEKEQLQQIAKVKTNFTLMPYTYFKLSSQSGYGAGNDAPQYYHMLWNAINENDIQNVAFRYMTQVTRILRKEGHFASTAQTIEAIALANQLAYLNNQKYPTLRDLQDAVTTCFGEGANSVVLSARLKVEIGNKMGELPQGVANTALQQDFQQTLKDLRLSKYMSNEIQKVALDLRENIRSKTEKGAYLDLNRSNFFNKLLLLEISFVVPLVSNQKDASWRENWNLQWSPAVEIQLVEASLLGDTLDRACLETMMLAIENSPTIEVIAQNILSSFECGLSESVNHFIRLLQQFSIESTDFIGITKALSKLYTIIQFGNLRRISLDDIITITENLFLKAILVMRTATCCTNEQINGIIQGMDILNKLSHLEEIEQDLYCEELFKLSEDLEINPFLAGYATAVLLEEKLFAEEKLEEILLFRLSSGVATENSANWLEGLCMKNYHYLTIKRNLWEIIDSYIASLGEEEFKRALLFLRRAFSGFSPNNKDSVIDNLKAIWKVEINNTVINDEVTTTEIEAFLGLEEFDFDDI